MFGNLNIGDVKDISEFLHNSNIFGVDLYDVDLGSKVQDYFNEMLAQKGGVRQVLNKYL